MAFGQAWSNLQLVKHPRSTKRISEMPPAVLGLIFAVVLATQSPAATLQIQATVGEAVLIDPFHSPTFSTNAAISVSAIVNPNPTDTGNFGFSSQELFSDAQLTIDGIAIRPQLTLVQWDSGIDNDLVIAFFGDNERVSDDASFRILSFVLEERPLPAVVDANTVLNAITEADEGDWLVATSLSRPGEVIGLEAYWGSVSSLRLVPAPSGLVGIQPALICLLARRRRSPRNEPSCRIAVPLRGIESYQQEAGSTGWRSLPV